MAKKSRIEPLKLTALILMLFPVLSIIGFIIYLVGIGVRGMSTLELIMIILTIPFFLFAAIFLWLTALGVIKL